MREQNRRYRGREGKERRVLFAFLPLFPLAYLLRLFVSLSFSACLSFSSSIGVKLVFGVRDGVVLEGM